MLLLLPLLMLCCCSTANMEAMLVQLPLHLPNNCASCTLFAATVIKDRLRWQWVRRFAAVQRGWRRAPRDLGGSTWSWFKVRVAP
jgi:hypothetical protein